MRRRKLHLLFGAVLMSLLVVLPLVSGCAPKEVAPPEEPVAEEPAVEEPAAEEPAPPEEEAVPPEEEAAPPVSELSFEAAEYVNADYGFSVKYPKDWTVTKGMFPIRGLTTVFLTASPGVVPQVHIDLQDVAEGATFADALTAVLEGAGGTGVNIKSESETTLADGTPASEAKVKWTTPYEGVAATSFSLGAIKENKWVIVTVTTAMFAGAGVPYDEALFSEITHTLQFK